MRLPCMSVIVTCVLLNVAEMFAMPVEMFLACFALTIFLAFASSPSSSAAVGVATTGAPVASTLAASAAGAAAAPFLGLVSSAALAGFSAAASGFASFAGAAFFLISSAIQIQFLVNAGLGIRVTLHTDSPTRTFAGTSVGLGTLTTHRQAAQVADATIALDGLQPLEIQTEFAAQIAFDHILAVLDRVNDLGQLRFGEVLRADRRVNVGAFENLDGVNRADAVDVTERDINALVRRNFYTNDACHKLINLVVVYDVCSCRSHATRHGDAQSCSARTAFLPRLELSC